MKIAITRQVSPTINQCELTHIAREPIDYERACAQHRQYENALRSLGMDIISSENPSDSHTATLAHGYRLLRA